MYGRTFFACEQAEFAYGEEAAIRFDNASGWKPAQVSVCEVTQDNRWLVVRVDNEVRPVVWRVITEGWILACDERTISMSMRASEQGIGSRTHAVEKLRFNSQEEFWSFVGHISYARLHASNPNWGGTTHQALAHGELDVPPTMDRE
ncbi:hypothetical protein ACG7TL_007351 [Trametes sanguinea]